MKDTIVILLVIICFFACQDNITSELSSVNSLKVYDLDVQRVKKIHKFFALIDTSKILFLNEDGDKVFDISNKDYKKNETIDFKFTDVVAGTNNNIFILGAEILKDSSFLIYVFKISDNGQMVWDNPVILPISNNYNFNYKVPITKSYFFISENGYALGCFSNNILYLVINGQSAKEHAHWYYKLIALNEAGSVLMESDIMQEEEHPEIWNFMIVPLPNGNLITSLAVGQDAYIHQFDSKTFEKKMTTKILATDIQARLPIFTNILHLNNEEVIFTGHANRENNLIVGGNFDAFLIKYNTTENIITDTLFSGANSSYELTFHSFLDANENVRCIGTKREDLFISHGPNSNLYETSFNLNSHHLDSLFFIRDKGYEGLYFEPIENTGLWRVLGRKLDISGQQNKQAFFTVIKP